MITSTFLLATAAIASLGAYSDEKCTEPAVKDAFAVGKCMTENSVGHPPAYWKLHCGENGMAMFQEWLDDMCTTTIYPADMIPADGKCYPIFKTNDRQIYGKAERGDCDPANPVPSSSTSTVATPTATRPSVSASTATAYVKSPGSASTRSAKPSAPCTTTTVHKPSVPCTTTVHPTSTPPVYASSASVASVAVNLIVAGSIAALVL